jgi:dinuclear metal center YbgI/SA1388 family protein
MRVAQLMTILDARAPAALAEEWDNIGLIVGRAGQGVGCLLVALELRGEVLDEAQRRGCGAVLVHHPPIFPAIRALSDASPSGDLVLRAAQAGVAVVAAHTNLDACPGGLNDIMAERLGITDCRPLRPSAGDPAAGLGRVGVLGGPTGLGAFAAKVARSFPGPVMRTGDADRLVTRVACCTGSGGALVDDAVTAGAEVYVTGDLKYHDADRAAPLALIDVPHAGVEREAMAGWCAGLGEALAAHGVPVHFAECDTDPWQPA